MNRTTSKGMLATLVALLAAACGARGEDAESVTETQQALIRRDPGELAVDDGPETAPPRPGRTIARFGQGTVSVRTRFFAYDVGPVIGDPTLSRINASGALIWNSGGRAYVYQNFASTDLGDLGGGQSVARSINANGDVVGKSLKDGRWRAFLYSNGRMRELGAPFPILDYEAKAINFWGDVVGVGSPPGNPQFGNAVTFKDGVAPSLATYLGNYVNFVMDMNDSHFVVGAYVEGSSLRAILSTNFGNLWRPILGVPGLDSVTRPSAINMSGHVVGTAGNGYVRAFISRDPAVPATDLGTLGGAVSAANGIAAGDLVVGWAEQSIGGGPRAFLHDGVNMVDLNSSLWNPEGWLLLEGHSINDAGQVVGLGELYGQDHIFFLQPIARSPYELDVTQFQMR